MSTAVCEKDAAIAPAVDVTELKTHLEVYGYVIVRNLIPRERAARMAARLMEIMRLDPDHEKQKLQNMGRVFDNLETQDDIDLFVPMLDNPVVMAIAEQMVGKNYQVSESGALWLKANAGYSGFGWHSDVPMNWFGDNNKPMPDTCFAINALWALTDFTKENGATRVVPMSHHSKRQIPVGGIVGSDGQMRFENEISAEAPAGSCVIFNNALWHAAGGNFTNQDRLGVSNPMFPIWLDGGNMGWTPIDRSTYEMLPKHVQRLHRHVFEDSVRPDRHAVPVKIRRKRK
jgi:ectoine hydroxylase-related dioxygenase (phytanoyl-CoA dioxygenase family)